MGDGCSGTVVVAGGAGGIGLATSRRLVAQGTSVAIADRVRPDMPESNEMSFFEVDVTDETALEAMVRALEADGRVTGLVNAAGILQVGDIFDVSPADWDSVVDINLKGCYLLVRAVLPALRRAGEGAIVLVSSTSGRTKSYFSSPGYVASKAGVIGLTMALAAQHAAEGIRVNCVAPGLIETPMIDSYDEEMRAGIAQSIPLRRAGTPDEVADVIVFLLSARSSYVTGQTLGVNGGIFMF